MANLNASEALHSSSNILYLVCETSLPEGFFFFLSPNVPMLFCFRSHLCAQPQKGSLFRILYPSYLLPSSIPLFMVMFNFLASSGGW